MQRSRKRLLATAALLVILVVTLVPLPSQTRAAEATPIWCLVCGDYGGVDVINNILLFVPFGLGLRLAGGSTRRVLAAGAGLSLAIELLQLGFIPGRDASLSDFLTNALGTWAGGAIGTRRSLLLFPSESQALRLASVGAILWLGLQATTALLLRPWIPPGELRSEWTPELPSKPRFPGRILFALVAGLPAGAGSEVQTAGSQRLRGGDIRVELSLENQGPRRRWAPLFQLSAAEQPFLAVESYGRSLVFQAPALSQKLRLRRPRLSMSEALPAGPGTSVFAAGESHDTLWVARGQHRAPGRVHLLSPSQSWSLIVPFSYSYGPEARLVTAAWLVVLCLPLAYWTGRRFRGWIFWTMAGLLLVAGLFLVPSFLSYSPVHWSEWLAGTAAFSLAAAVTQGSTYFRQRCGSLSTNESC